MLNVSLFRASAPLCIARNELASASTLSVPHRPLTWRFETPSIRLKPSWIACKLPRGMLRQRLLPEQPQKQKQVRIMVVEAVCMCPHSFSHTDTFTNLSKRTNSTLPKRSLVLRPKGGGSGSRLAHKHIACKRTRTHTFACKHIPLHASVHAHIPLHASVHACKLAHTHSHSHKHVVYQFVLPPN